MKGERGSEQGCGGDREKRRVGGLGEERDISSLNFSLTK